MTDRIFSLTVALAKDMTQEEAQKLKNSIAMLRGVIAVTGNVVTPDLWTAEMRVKVELGSRLCHILSDGATLSI